MKLIGLVLLIVVIVCVLVIKPTFVVRHYNDLAIKNQWYPYCDTSNVFEKRHDLNGFILCIPCPYGAYCMRLTSGEIVPTCKYTNHVVDKISNSCVYMKVKK